MSRRAQKKVSTYSSGSWSLTSSTTYLYDGWNLIQELPVPNSELPTVSYVWGLDLSGSLQGAGGIGGLLSRISENAAHYYTYDANGNVGQLVDESATIAAHYEYDPFGNTINSHGLLAVDNPYRFSTKYLDAATGLYYYGYRYYSPTLGRWLNRDPKKERGGKNLYGFVVNSPLNYFDRLGLEASSKSGCKCGPDITAWLDSLMRFNASSPDLAEILFDNEDAALAASRFDRIGAAGFKKAAYKKFIAMVDYRKPWDLKDQYDLAELKSASCPSSNCKQYLTICNKCYQFDVPGNIHYGFLGHRAGFTLEELMYGASGAQILHDIKSFSFPHLDPPQDTNAITVGWLTASTSLCSALNAYHKELYKKDECAPCKECVSP